MLNLLRKYLPSSWLRAYHFTLAHLASLWYRHPSKRMHVIGVTGTNGKSSTVELMGQLLIQLGETIGWTSSNSFRIGATAIPNKTKMGMLGRFATHRLLRDMVRAGCTYAIVETSSQGIDQFRHVGIDYDTLVFTNLTPEHIEAHGGFENYKQAKLTIFRQLNSRPKKMLAGREIPRTIVVNLDDEHAKDFAACTSDVTIGFSAEGAQPDLLVDRALVAQDVQFDETGVRAQLDGAPFSTSLVGPYYFKNTMAAIAGIVAAGKTLSEVLTVTDALKPIPGRLETFEHNGAKIIVDYAPEPYALDALYEAIKPLQPKRIVHVGGACGGGRDRWKWSVLGEAAAKRDDIFIVTDEDPYDDDPMEIINAIADTAALHGKQDDIDLFRILDRQKAINKALQLAGPGDVVLITGKGSEPMMAVANRKKIPWDDREAVRKAMEL